MKKHVLFASLLLVALLFGANSCKKADVANETAPISKEIQGKIRQLGFDPSEAFEYENGYIVEGDIFLTREEVDNVQPNFTSYLVGDEEQYHTTNLVTGLPRVITISIASQLPASYVTALDIAIARYNAENLQITMQRVSSGANISMVKAGGNFLASAGFPTSTGNPYNQVKLNSNAIGNGTSTAFLNYVATIMAHELGHCVGFRHTDYMNRAYSCGGNPVNEGDGGVGAILIPGTPSGPDPNSWMLACIGANQNRPFNANDVTALNYLY